MSDTQEVSALSTFGITEVANTHISRTEYERLMNKEVQIANYPVATTVYYKLSRDMGLNDYCCAGILANMMVECGGSTLDLKWDAWDETRKYYGLCQWSIEYHPLIKDMDIQEQLDYLEETLADELDIFGYRYSEDFGYIAFTQLDQSTSAALAFAKCYERCHEDYYIVRTDNAETALKFIQSIK